MFSDHLDPMVRLESFINMFGSEAGAMVRAVLHVTQADLYYSNFAKDYSYIIHQKVWKACIT